MKGCVMVVSFVLFLLTGLGGFIFFPLWLATAVFGALFMLGLMIPPAPREWQPRRTRRVMRRRVARR